MILYIVAKSPRMGKVKTRLAKRIGEQNAYHFFCYSLRATLALCRRTQVEFVWVTDRFSALFPCKQLIIENLNIGEVISEVLLQHPKELPYGFIGGDTPHIKLSWLQQEVLKMRRVPAIAPSLDGGFYLYLAPAFTNNSSFVGIDWTRSDIFKQVQLKSREIEVLCENFDVDEYADLEMLCSLSTLDLLPAQVLCIQKSKYYLTP